MLSTHTFRFKLLLIYEFALHCLLMDKAEEISFLFPVYLVFLLYSMSSHRRTDTFVCALYSVIVSSYPFICLYSVELSHFSCFIRIVQCAVGSVGRCWAKLVVSLILVHSNWWFSCARLVIAQLLAVGQNQCNWKALSRHNKGEKRQKRRNKLYWMTKGANSVRFHR